jgi:putative MFS transporter
MPVIVKEWHLDQVTIGMLASAGFWGMLFGAVVWGPIADKWGRKVGFAGSILGFSLLTGLTTLSAGVSQFIVFRFLSGICLGGMIPIDQALVSEYVSPKHRGRFLAVLAVAFPFGMLGAAFASLTLVPQHGWRILFVLGVLPALVALLAIASLPESPRWLAIKGKKDQTIRVLHRLGATKEDVKDLGDEQQLSERVPASILLRPPYLRRFVLTVGYYFCGNVGYYGFAVWLPSILAGVFKLTLVKTFTYTAIAGVVAILSRMFAFYTVEKFGRKQLFYVGYGLGGVAALIFGLIKNPAYLLWGVCVLAFFYEQGIAGNVILTAELYPSKIRATATSWSTAAARVAAASSSMLFGYFFFHHMYYMVYVTMAFFFWIAVVLVYTLGIETKDRSLEDIDAA